MTRTASLRTLLFVPGDRPERFSKAAAAGADVTIIDLEDAVAADAKDIARHNAVQWVDAGHYCVIRINAPGTPQIYEDLQALAGRRCAILLPKAEDPQWITEYMSDHPVLALIETAAGVLAAQHIAGTRGVERLVFGNFDLAAQLGISPDDRDALAALRSALVLSSAAAGIAPPIDGVTGSISDEEMLVSDIAYAARLGFGGKLLIHPRQVNAASAAFAPTSNEIAWAQRILAASVSAVAVVDGKMVDKPVIVRAQRILARQR